MEKDKIKTSKWRIIGTAFFGFLLGRYSIQSFEYTIPRIFSIIKKVGIEEGYEIYANSTILSLILTVLVMFLASVVAGFLARKKGILVGLLANSFSIILLGLVFYLAIIGKENLYIGNIPAQLYTSISFISVILVSILGGYLGQKYYSPEIDLDLEKNRLTIFGIRWFHYFWIFPLIIYSFLSTAIIAIYASILVSLAGFYYTVHPSIWFSSWLIYLFFVPALVMIAVYLLGFAFIRFWELMQYGQEISKGWKHFLWLLLYGVGVPILSFFITANVIEITYNMSKPITGDWKLGIGLVLIIPTIIFIVNIFSWLKGKLSRNTDDL
ncbi:MAG: hypothetical protein WC283_02875 [Candidatus Paceibacterota bacterium]|jgi:hypothetical protein